MKGVGCLCGAQSAAGCDTGLPTNAHRNRGSSSAAAQGPNEGAPQKVEEGGSLPFDTKAGILPPLFPLLLDLSPSPLLLSIHIPSSSSSSSRRGTAPCSSQ